MSMCKGKGQRIEEAKRERMVTLRPLAVELLLAADCAFVYGRQLSSPSLYTAPLPTDNGRSLDAICNVLSLRFAIVRFLHRVASRVCRTPVRQPCHPRRTEDGQRLPGDQALALRCSLKLSRLFITGVGRSRLAVSLGLHSVFSTCTVLPDT